MGSENKKENLPHERLVHALNEQGIFFQSKCVEIVRSLSEKTKFFIYDQEYPVKINEKETKIDVIIGRIALPDYTYIVTECKRANPDYVTWIFLYHSKNKIKLQNFRTSTLECCSGLNKGINLSSYIVEFKTESLSDSIICSQAISVKKGYKQKKSSLDDIDSACHQVFIGLHGLMIEEKKEMGLDEREHKRIFIPLIVTNANLKVGSYSHKDVDIKTGNIDPNNVQFEDVRWLVYEYNLSEDILHKDLAHAGDNVNLLMRSYSKRKPVFIVNINHLKDFLINMDFPLIVKKDK